MANILITLGAKTTTHNSTYADIDTDADALNTRLLDIHAIRNSIRNHLSWRQGERILNPSFGNVLYQYLYEGTGDVNPSMVEQSVRTMLSDESRISITRVNANIDPDNHECSVTVIYSIPSLGTTDSTTVTLTKS
jgi:phage baseplate assembly protein W